MQSTRLKPVIQLKNFLLLNHHLNQSTLARTVQACKPHQSTDRSTESNDRLRPHNNRTDLNSKSQVQSLESKRPPLSSYKPIQTKSDLDRSKPDKDSINQFYKYAEQEFPKFFRTQINTYYFEQDLTVEDNMSGVTKMSVGYSSLLRKVMYTRLYYSAMYSFNKMSVLSMAKIPEEGVVKVRWRITSKGRLFIFLQFWRFREIQRIEYFTDGITEFHLNGQGKAKLIVLDKIEKDTSGGKLLDPLEKVVKV